MYPYILYGYVHSIILQKLLPVEGGHHSLLFVHYKPN